MHKSAFKARSLGESPDDRAGPLSRIHGTRERGKGLKQQGEKKEKQSSIRSVRVSHPDQVKDGISLDAPAARIAAYGSMRELVLLGNCSESSQIGPE